MSSGSDCGVISEIAKPVPPRRTVEEVLADPRAIERALRRGVQRALLDHKRAGNPIAEWRDGRVVWIPPDEIVVDEE